MRKDKKFKPIVDGMENRFSLSGVSPTTVVVSTMLAPDSGDDPPVTQPDLPPSGPGGPGTSS